MRSRIHQNSDILDNGKIMLITDNEAGCLVLTDLQYSEHALRELLVDTHKTIQKAISAKDDFPLDSYVNILASLTNSLKNITSSLLAVKTEMQAEKKDDPVAVITESYTEKLSEIQKNQQFYLNINALSKKNVLNFDFQKQKGR